MHSHVPRATPILTAKTKNRLLGQLNRLARDGRIATILKARIVEMRFRVVKQAQIGANRSSHSIDYRPLCKREQTYWTNGD